MKNEMCMKKFNEIEINGIKYAKKGQPKEIIDNYVIVRTRSADVFAGEIVKKEGIEITLRNVRRLWFWDGAATLSQLAMEGVKKPENCQFPCEVAQITSRWIEIIPCTQKAIDSIRGVAIWEEIKQGSGSGSGSGSGYGYKDGSG